MEKITGGRLESMQPAPESGGRGFGMSRASAVKPRRTPAPAVIGTEADFAEEG
jgi:hypothetical protein